MAANERQVETVRAEWQAVKRKLVAARPGSPQAEYLDAEFDRLRDEYVRLADMAREAEGNPPPLSSPVPDGPLLPEPE